MLLKACACLICCLATLYLGIWLMNRADRRGVSLIWMTVLVIPAAICFIIAVISFLVGTYSLADFLGNLGR